MEMPPAEIRAELSDIVREFYLAHKFLTYGDAVSWLHEATYEEELDAAGKIGSSQFQTEILWLTGLFGPTANVDYKEIIKPT